jgi:hypothetical protein
MGCAREALALRWGDDEESGMTQVRRKRRGGPRESGEGGARAAGGGGRCECSGGEGMGW